MNINKLRALLWALGLSIAGTAHSATIDGEVAFVGGGMTSYSLLGGNDFLTSTGIDFSNSLELFAGGTGDYANVPPLWLVRFGSISINAFSPMPQRLWSFSFGQRQYWFDLSSLSVEARTANEITLVGQGKLNITGFDPTDGQWNFTANTYGSVFTFSSGAIAAPIAAPEIDAKSGTSAIALLAGVLLLAAERSRRSIQVAR